MDGMQESKTLIFGMFLVSAIRNTRLGGFCEMIAKKIIIIKKNVYKTGRLYIVNGCVKNTICREKIKIKK
jgi:hypothetical protein